MAHEARGLVRGLLDNAQTITLSIDDNPKEVRGKYFRIVGRLGADGVDISELLIQRPYAVAYDGGTKVKDWGGDALRLLRQFSTCNDTPGLTPKLTTGFIVGPHPYNQSESSEETRPWEP